MTRSSSAGAARPVRTVENSCWAASVDLTMRSRASASSSSIMLSAAIAVSLGCRDKSAHALARDYPRKVLLVVHVEHVERHRVLHTKRESRGVHHPQAALDRLHVRDLGDELSARVDGRVGR